MPAIRSAATERKALALQRTLLPYSRRSSSESSADLEFMDYAKCEIHYPISAKERESFKTQNGKRVTDFQWRLYDYLKTIPAGYVTTYGDMSKALNSSPRAVGNALRQNPFAPFIPCHRVIAASLYIGGFKGEWGLDSKKSSKGSKTQAHDKLSMLKNEGVMFDSNGYLKNSSKYLWK